MQVMLVHQVHQVKGFLSLGRGVMPGKTQPRETQGKWSAAAVYMGSCAHTALFMGTYLLQQLTDSHSDRLPVANIITQILQRVAVHLAHPAEFLVVR